MAQPAAQFESRQLVRSVPFSTPRVLLANVGAGGGGGFGFDVGLALSDRNQLGYAVPLIGFPTIATGFFLDVSVRATQAGTIDILFQIDPTSQSRSVMAGGAPLAFAATTLIIASAGLRVVGTFVTVNYVNTAGVAADVELYAAIRST